MNHLISMKLTFNFYIRPISMEKQVKSATKVMYLLKQVSWCQARLLRKYIKTSFIKSTFQRGTLPVKFARVLHFERWRKLSSGGRCTTSDIARFNPLSARTLNSILALMTLSSVLASITHSIVFRRFSIFIRANVQMSQSRVKSTQMQSYSFRTFRGMFACCLYNKYFWNALS